METNFKTELVRSVIGVTSVKQAEAQIQKTIEKFYPKDCWWKTTDIKIFEELALSRRTVIEVIDMIVDDIKAKENKEANNE